MTTTNLEKLKSNGFKDFTWGTIEKYYSFGPYDIVKSIDKEGNTGYHGWVYGKRCSNSACSLDNIILVLMASKNNNGECTAARYAGLVLNTNLLDDEEAVRDVHS